MRVRTLLEAAVALVLLLGGAGWVSAQAATTIPTIMTVRAQNTGCVVSLKTGDTLIVELDSNPSTGYSWAESHKGDEVVSLQKMEHRKGVQGDAPGAAGKDVWTFAMIRPGRQRLSFQYQRPWEKDVPAAKMVWYSIVVQRP